MNAAKYSEVLKQLEKKGAGAPKGRLYHVSYGSPDNLQVIDVWEDEKTFKAFASELDDNPSSLTALAQALAMYLDTQERKQSPK